MNRNETSKIISFVEKSISSKKPLIFTYTKYGEVLPEERKVVFQRIYSRNNHTYAVGFCFKRESNRTFRIDRFNEIVRLEDTREEIPESDLETEYFDYTSDPLAEYLMPDEEEIKQNNDIAKTSEKKGHVGVSKVFTFILNSIGILFLISFILTGFISVMFPGIWDKIFKEKNDYYANYSPIKYEKVKGRDRNYRDRNIIKIERKYRGYIIEKRGSYYIIKGLKGRYNSIYDVIIKINTVKFEKITKIENKKLIKFYVDADKDRNGFLSWKEIGSFQLYINQKFKYKPNNIALRPDEFLKDGGGDCEDWALFTAGLLRFWDYKPYIGSLNYKDKYHAITLVKVNKLPFKFRGYKITYAKLNGKDIAPKGIYTFIDYYRVGRLTRAGGRKPRLINIRIPEKCYGKIM